MALERHEMRTEASTTMTEQWPIVNGSSMSHGTLECRVLKDSKRFFREFLGLASVRHHEGAVALSSAGYPWAIACVHAGDGVHVQGPENRWGIQLESPEDVDRGHAAALAHRDEYSIRRIEGIEERDGGRFFLLQDADGNWWEIGHWPADYFEELFRNGDRG